MSHGTEIVKFFSWASERGIIEGLSRGCPRSCWLTVNATKETTLPGVQMGQHAGVSGKEASKRLLGCS